jgi:hypothetical protein
MRAAKKFLALSLLASATLAGAEGISREYQALGLELHSEQTSFEAMVRHQQSTSRGPAAAAARFRVISIRRELGLTRYEAERAPIDIIINAGQDQGLARGDVLRVFRKVSVIDPYQDNLQRELEIPFAIVRIKHSQPGIAVARMEKIDTIEQGLALGVRGVLVGDYLGFSE